MPDPELTVVAAVIERGGKILVCQRNAGGRHSLKWEFPGGKVELGEDPALALKRELREELGINAEIGIEMARYDVRYAQGPVIHLRFYNVTAYRGDLRNLDFAQIVWAAPESLLDYDFLEGDIEFVSQLASSSKLTSATRLDRASELSRF
jgi:8-oxo-dGTP diphosphatase